MRKEELIFKDDVKLTSSGREILLFSTIIKMREGVTLPLDNLEQGLYSSDSPKFKWKKMNISICPKKSDS